MKGQLLKWSYSRGWHVDAGGQLGDHLELLCVGE